MFLFFFLMQVDSEDVHRAERKHGFKSSKQRDGGGR